MKRNKTMGTVMKKGWEIKRLGEFSKISYGYTAKASFNQNGLKFLRITDIQENQVDWETVPSCTMEESDFKKYALSEGDIVFARTGATTGKSFLIKNPPKAVFASYLIKVQVAHKSINSDFVLMFFQTKNYWDKISEGTIGSAQGGFNASKLADLLIPLPPLPEQYRIVTILDEAFAAIAKAKENAEKNLANALEIFDIYMNNFFTNSDNRWEETTLGEVCEKVEYGTSSKSKGNGKMPVLRMGNIQNRRFVWDNLVYSNDEVEINKYLLKFNDVLFNRTNSPELVGKSAIYKGEMPSIFAGYLIRLHRKENLIDADYLNYYLSSERAINFGKTVVISSVNQANINGTKLKKYPIPFPPLTEQQSFVTRLDELSIETKKLEVIYKQKLADLDELKKSILEKAFRGELVTENELQC